MDAIHPFNQLDLLPLAFSRAKDAKLCKTCAEKFSGKKQNSEQELASHHHQQRHQASGVHFIDLVKNIRSRHHQMLSVATFFMVYRDGGEGFIRSSIPDTILGSDAMVECRPE